MAIANSLCFTLRQYTYKSNTVCARALLRAQQGSLPQTLDLGKRSPTTNAQNISVFLSSVCLLQEEWCKSGDISQKVLLMKARGYSRVTKSKLFINGVKCVPIW